MPRFFRAAIAAVLLAGLSACSGNPFANAISVTVTNAFSTIQTGAAPVTLTAVVANDKGKAGVKWMLTLGNQSCSPSCGTLVPSASPSLTAVYTPPSTLPTNQSATITAISVADPTKIYVFNLTIVAPPPVISVTITNKFTTQAVGGSQVTVNATVQNDSANAGVTWTLTSGGSGGTACSPACGTLTPSASPSLVAVYQPPTTQPTGPSASPTITATSVTDTTKTDSFTFNIISGAALFNGPYAFLLRGYDTTGSPMAMAGSFTSDGNGNITAGEIDFNNGGGVTSIPSATGTYTTDTSFNGVLRGSITITSYTFPNSTNNLVLKFTLSADATRGRILELDGSGFINSGTMLKQDASAISGGTIAGTYAFGLDSDAPVGGRTVENGQLVVATGGGITGIVDQSKAGNATPTYSATPIASGSTSTAPDASGRGAMTVVVSGTTSTYAYYLVNASQLYLIQIDPGHTFGTAQAGVARAQAQLTADSANTIGQSVLQMTGMDTPTGTDNIGPDVIIGTMSIQGATATSGTFSITFDSNDLGTILTNHPAAGTLMSFDPTTGRGVLAINGGFNTGFMDSAVFYLYQQGDGFIIDADPSTNTGITNNAFSGTFTEQTANFALSGNLLGGSVGSAIADIPNFEAALNVSGQTGAATGAGDLTSLPDQLGNVPNVSFTGLFTITSFPLGYGTATLPQGLFTPTPSSNQGPASFYFVGPNQLVVIGTQSGVYSGISFFDPE
jgi:hypothetical protein